MFLSVSAPFGARGSRGVVMSKAFCWMVVPAVILAASSQAHARYWQTADGKKVFIAELIALNGDEEPRLPAALSPLVPATMPS